MYFSVHDSFLKHSCCHFISMLRISLIPVLCLRGEGKCQPLALSVHYSLATSCSLTLIPIAPSKHSPSTSQGYPEATIIPDSWWL